MDFRKKIRDLISKQSAKEGTLYANYIAHSRAYMSCLGIFKEDLKILDRVKQAFLSFTIDDHDFHLEVDLVCGCPYGGDWIEAITVICTSHPEVNEHTGGGTMFINVVSDEWHRRILAHIGGEDTEMPDEKPDVQAPSWLDEEFKKYWA